MLSRKVNILLLGETGVGKSTFINMIGNYLSKKSVHEIASGKCNLLVPTKFSLQGENFVDDIIEVGSSEYEVPGTGQSATRRPEMYVFNDPDHNVVLQIIDTPGVGDTRGLEYDEMNAEMVLNYISELPSMDAFCILLRPDVVRISAQFELCLRKILEQLNKNIVGNIIFVFTHGRMRNFEPGDTNGCLEKLLTDIERECKAVIPYTDNNKFCIDNESFRYIVGTQQGRTFPSYEVSVYEDSFKWSRRNVNRLITHIISLQPARLQGVTSINESKRIIQRLIEPLITLITLYENAICEIKEYNEELITYTNDIEFLKQNMYKIEHVPVTTGTTVDTHNSNINLSFDFRNLLQIGWKMLQSFRPFDFIYSIFSKKETKTELVTKKYLDKDAIAEIRNQETAKKAVEAKRKEMNNLCKEYEVEVNTILETIATFSIFIENLKLISSQDFFKTIMDLILNQHLENDKKILTEQIQYCLRNYDHIKKRIGKDVKSKDVMHCLKNLFRLKHTGHIFKEIIDQKIDFNKIIFYEL